MDFALKKDPAEGKYLVFFKSRDADALNAAFAEYTAKTLRRCTPKKRYNFSLLAADPTCPRLAVAESPIDALSLATLVKRSGGEWRDSHYLSLGGTAPRTMLQFLHDHPHVTHLSLCLDNDKAGMEGMERLEQSVQEDAELAQRVKLIYHNPPPMEFGKDYNEFLCTQIKWEQDVKHKKIVEYHSAL